MPRVIAFSSIVAGTYEKVFKMFFHYSVLLNLVDKL